MSTAAPLQNTAKKSTQVRSSSNAGLQLQRKCACGSPTSSPTTESPKCKSKKSLQAKLTIGASNDPLEQEADRIADQVLAAPAHPAAGSAAPHIQRFTEQATEGADTAPASVDHILTSHGRPLDPALQQDMEQRFGYDFSRVRVHSDAAAEQSAREVHANAYAVGNNIVFGASRFAPETYEGRRLIAHELTHVVQQTSSDEIRVDQSNEKCGLSHGLSPIIAIIEGLAGNAASNPMLRRKPDEKKCGPGFWPPQLDKLMFFGQREHFEIQKHYMEHYNTAAVFEYSIPESSPNEEKPGRADIVEPNTLAIYEIKSGQFPGEHQKGKAEVAKYVRKAKKFCGPGKGWHAGKNYSKYPVLIVTQKDRVLLAILASPGVILYLWVSRQPNENPETIVVRVTKQIKVIEAKLAAEPTKAIKESSELTPSVASPVKAESPLALSDSHPLFESLLTSTSTQLGTKKAPAGTAYAIIAPVAFVSSAFGEAKLESTKASLKVTPKPGLLLNKAFYKYVGLTGLVGGIAILAGAGAFIGAEGVAAAGTVAAQILAGTEITLTQVALQGLLVAANTNAVQAAAAAAVLLYLIYKVTQTGVEVTAVQAVPSDLLESKEQISIGKLVQFGKKDHFVIGTAVAKKG